MFAPSKPKGQSLKMLTKGRPCATAVILYWPGGFQTPVPSCQSSHQYLSHHIHWHHPSRAFSKPFPIINSPCSVQCQVRKSRPLFWNLHTDVQDRSRSPQPFNVEQSLAQSCAPTPQIISLTLSSLQICFLYASISLLGPLLALQFSKPCHFPPTILVSYLGQLVSTFPLILTTPFHPITFEPESDSSCVLHV